MLHTGIKNFDLSIGKCIFYFMSEPQNLSSSLLMAIRLFSVIPLQMTNFAYTSICTRVSVSFM